MFSLFRGQHDHSRSERTPLLCTFPGFRSRHVHDSGRSVSGADNDNYEHFDDFHQDDREGNGPSRSHARDGPLLPVFSETLDNIPLYNTTHAIRILVIQRCETTLSWDQLRSPQVSQFLVKPVQQQILSDHFSRGTLYCLLANSLQFRKEGEDNPGNVGVSRSRAFLCELLAMRLLKDFSTRELIDALSYDFDPLQGMAPPMPGTITPAGRQPRSSLRSARTSTLEVAIRAQAKRFLAHPLVVQQLEAIWAGTIVFHSAADSLHRQPEATGASMGRSLLQGRNPSKHSPGDQTPVFRAVRRTVTLYDPYDASLFKLSRLRVPRYRQLFSTVSFAIMLGLFVAVLFQKSDDITALEILFWFWSSGYMLDEIVGFSEQGPELYIMSVWNAFDLGILLLFIAYYVLRIYGILTPTHNKGDITRMAYDVLGSSAVLLFPRLFSVLDHSRYFSQLLIAFRMMALDLMAILLLIIISCSGFFVAFTLSFNNDFGASNAAYALFQMLMGFTPAAWDMWGDYNVLGKGLLTLFLFICHFLIVTILVTVLTNSFMAIAQNANEEHQFLFAVNTISMVKSNVLFSYIPPTNILGWLVIPLTCCMSFRGFVKLNRTVIKMTHMPILFSIFLYERFLLSNFAYGPVDLVEQRGRSHQVAVPAFSIRGAAGDIFSPGVRVREPSITTFHKDQALEEVFRRPFRVPGTTALSERNTERRNSSNVVRDWMNGVRLEGEDSPPLTETRSVLDRLELRRPWKRRMRRSKMSWERARSFNSNPENTNPLGRPAPIAEEEGSHCASGEYSHQQTDADGDDELVTNDGCETGISETGTTEDSNNFGEGGWHNRKEEMPHNGIFTSLNSTLGARLVGALGNDHAGASPEEDYFHTPMTAKPNTPFSHSFASSAYGPDETPRPKASITSSRPGHTRHTSSNTVLFSPIADETSRSPSPRTATPARMATDGRRTPRRAINSAITTSHPRPIMPPRNIRNSAATFDGFVFSARQREPSFNAIALDLASDLGDNRHGPDVGTFGALPSSLTTQFEMASRAKSQGNDEATRMSRIMLARMTTLEEGFRDVLKELRKVGADGGQSRASSKRSSLAGGERSQAKKKGKKRQQHEGEASGQRSANLGSSV